MDEIISGLKFQKKGIWLCVICKYFRLMTTITRQVKVIMVTGAGFLMSFMELIQDTEKVEQAGQDTEDSLPFNLLMFNFKNILRK